MTSLFFLTLHNVSLKNFAKFLHAAIKFHKSLGASLKGFAQERCKRAIRKSNGRSFDLPFKMKAQTVPEQSRALPSLRSPNRDCPRWCPRDQSLDPFFPSAPRGTQGKALAFLLDKSVFRVAPSRVALRRIATLAP